MTEEEKEAIKFFYNLRATIDESNMLFDEEIEVKHGKETIKQITTILNLIEKLLKENEQLRTEVNSLKKENEELNEKILDNAGIYQLGFKDGEESYIKKVKDKIRKNEEIIDISNDGDLIHELYQKNKVYEELLESEK
jgi:glutathionyl-hydroquinone reductase|nr:MAG TPA: hypothetical protein [Caudoviricetes sp.]